MSWRRIDIKKFLVHGDEKYINKEYNFMDTLTPNIKPSEPKAISVTAHDKTVGEDPTILHKHSDMTIKNHMKRLIERRRKNYV